MASRRPARRRYYRRRRANSGLWIALLVGAVILLLIVRTVSEHPLGAAVLVVLLAGAAVGGYLVHQRQQQARFELRATHAYTLAEYHRMTATQFERALADLCRRDGCTRVKVVGGAGDLGADVIAMTPAGQRLVLQAKRYAPSTKVGSGDMQKVGGTARQIHGADIAAVVTTSTFTRHALDYSRRLGIRTYDGTALAGWASRTGPAPWE
ncbi:restriction endonuclease [Kitasatospora viridis]|uniref:Restriction system protein n=1 Tax=Kitasatospora viridis TaxID=281105 RepID=A0A561UBJ5_9ACTN|nr:restriction endonuclease [Kitasatospora viridis]TWF96716.1 restriction system protein [Kitasatospora viridis]